MTHKFYNVIHHLSSGRNGLDCRLGKWPVQTHRSLQSPSDKRGVRQVAEDTQALVWDYEARLLLTLCWPYGVVRGRLRRAIVLHQEWILHGADRDSFHATQIRHVLCKRRSLGFVHKSVGILGMDPSANIELWQSSLPSSYGSRPRTLLNAILKARKNEHVSVSMTGFP